MRLALALIAVSLAGCKSDLVRVDPTPTLVHLPVFKYQPLPKDLIVDCYDEKPREQTYAEAKRLANLRYESIAECNARLAKIRALQAFGIAP